VNITDGITFEILPAFEFHDGGWLYPNAMNGGYWKQCNPRAEIAEIHEASFNPRRSAPDDPRVVHVRV
jgi:Second Messenger Oligonucleotide or Dinucleotide Synthetase domain